MEHVGIDLGSRRSHVVVLDDKGNEVLRDMLDTRSLGDWLSKREPSRVVMEAGTQSPAIGHLSVVAKHETFVVPGNVVRTLGVGWRGIKTDFRDAEVLARASVRNETLPTAHMRSDESREHKLLCATRAQLVKARAGIAVTIKSWLRSRLITMPGRANSAAFAHKVRELATQHPDGLPSCMETMLTTFEFLNSQVEVLDAQVNEIVEADKVCQNLVTVPGIGPMIALAFRAEVDDPNRFKSAGHLASHLALVPGENSTGGAHSRTGLIHLGPRHLKALLIQAAWTLRRCRPNDPVVLWNVEIEKRRGKHVAVVALARKLATIMWAMWKHGRSYNPRAASSVRASRASTLGSGAPTSEVAE